MTNITYSYLSICGGTHAENVHHSLIELALNLLGLDTEDIEYYCCK